MEDQPRVRACEVACHNHVELINDLATMCVEKKYLDMLLFSPLNKACYEYQNLHCYSNHHNSLSRHLFHLR